MKSLTIKHKEIKLPAFFPDATRAVIKALDTKDLLDASVEGLVVNTYHLMFKPGIENIAKLNGVAKFMNWPNPLISDSGGFQMMSLIHKSSEFGEIFEKGIRIHIPDRGKLTFTPEYCIQTQFTLDTDIMICLDDCPKIGATREEIQEAVHRTIRWAKRCKNEYLNLVKEKGLTDTTRPLLFAVIQGGSHKDLRAFCAQELLKIGFDGYGYGGWPMTRTNTLDVEYLEYVCKLVPNEFPKYALGVGLPHEIAICVKLGYSIFDCVLPTRDARHQRLYVLNAPLTDGMNLENREFYSFLNISRKIFEADNTPISEFCDCYACKNYTKAYLHHLFKIEDSLAFRLASIHNLRLYSQVIDTLRG